MKQFSYEDFAHAFGCSEEDVKTKAGRLIDAVNLEYRVFEGQERDAVILKTVELDRSKAASAISIANPQF